MYLSYLRWLHIPKGPGTSAGPGVGPSFGEDECTPSDWDPSNARMMDEEQAIARRQAAEPAAEAAAAGRQPPPLSSADAAAGGGPHTMYIKYYVFILLKMNYVFILLKMNSYYDVLQ